MTEILLVRHGESEWNAAGRWQGWADPPLTPLGQAQATAAADAVDGIEVVASSDLRRAVSTAETIAGRLGTGAVTQDQGLRERDVGEWTGLTRPEIDRRWPDWRTWAEQNNGFIEAPGGERHADFLARILNAVARVAERHAGARILAVSHGGVIRTLERHLGIEPDAIPNLAGRWLTVAPGSLEAGERVMLVDPEEIEVTIPPPH